MSDKPQQMEFHPKDSELMTEIREHLSRSLESFLSLKSGEADPVTLLLACHNFYKRTIIMLERCVGFENSTMPDFFLRKMAIDTLIHGLEMGEFYESK